MAKAGNYAAYRKVQPTNGGLVEDIKYWNEDRAERRHEARLDAGIEQAKKDKKKADQDALYDRIKTQNIWETNSTSGNDLIRRGIAIGREQYTPLLEIIANENSTIAQRTDAETKLDNLNNLADNMKAMFEKHSTEYSTWKSAVDKDLIHDNPEQNKAWQGGFKNYRIGLDENMNPVLAFVDQDGDGENDNVSEENLLGIMPFESIFDDTATFDNQVKHDMKTAAAAISEKVGISDDTTIENYTSNQIKGYKDGAVKTLVDQLLNRNKDGELSSEAKSFLIQAGLDPQSATDDQLDELKAGLIEMVNSLEDTTNKETEDNSGRNGAVRNALAKKNSKGVVSGFGEAVTPSNQTWGEELTPQLASGAKSVPVSGVKMSAIRDNNKGIESNAEINNYTYHQDGNILLDVSVPKTKSVSKKEYEKIKEISETGEGAEKQKNMDILLSLIGQKEGEMRITIPGTNDKKVVKGSPEDEANVAKQLNVSIKELRQNAGYNGKVDNSPVVGQKTKLDTTNVPEGGF